MTSNQERREKYAQKQKEQVVWKGDQFQTTLPPTEQEPAPNVTVKDAEPQPQKTLVDKMRAKFAPGSEHKPEPTKQPTTRGKPKPNLMLTVFPGMVATFISTFLTDVYKDPYKPCAPTKDESLLIITPLFEEISRAIKVTGKIDQTTENLLNCVAMMLLYGARAYQTYVQIKRTEKEKNDGNKAGISTTPSTKIANEYIPGTDTRTIRPDTASVTSPDAEGNGNGNASIGEESDTERREREAALIHDMFKRDVEGRIRLGVLPARVRDDNRDANK